MKDFLIASILASCAFCAAVSAGPHPGVGWPAAANARTVADPLEDHAKPLPVDIETALARPQSDPSIADKPATPAESVDTSSTD